MKPTAAFQTHQTIANSPKSGSNNNSFSLQNAFSPQETSKLFADAQALQLPGKKCGSTYLKGRVRSTWGTTHPQWACPLLPLYQSPHPKLWFGGKKTGEAAVVPSCFHPSPTQTNVLMTGVTRCNVVSQVIISITGMNSSQKHKVTSFTA